MDEPVPAIDGRTLRFAHRRQELLNGAIRYAIEHGVTDLSMRKLATGLGVSHTALAHHFGSKEQLVFEIFEQLRKASVASIEGATDPADGLDAYAAWWPKWTAAEFIPALRLVIEVLGLAVRNPEQYSQLVTEPAARWLEILIPALRAHHCPEDELEGAASALMAFGTGLQVDLLITDDRERVNAAHAAFLRMLDARRQQWAADADAEADAH